MSKNRSLFACLGLGLAVLSLIACSQTTTPEPPNMIAHLSTETIVPISPGSPTPTRSATPRKTRVPVNAATEQSQKREARHTFTPSPAPTATSKPTYTPTPKPVPPLVAHEWTTEPILLRFGQIGGDGADPLDYSLPSLILYSDGRLIFRQWEKSNQDDLRVKLWEVDLSRQEICALLNTIDQTGFFDYDPSTYLPEGTYLPFEGASNTVIEVHAWRSKQISLNGLWVFLGDEPSMAGAIVFGDPSHGTMPYIPAALQNTYKVLSHFKPDNATTYQPNRLAIRIGYPEVYAHGVSWPLTSTELIDLYNRSNSGQDLVITKGAESAAIYQVFDNTMDGRMFEDGTHTFFVAVRPLLPYERISFNYSYNPIDAPADFKKPMNCEPADGVLPVPEADT